MSERKKILVPTSGYIPAKESGNLIIEVAKRFGADVEVVHIRDPRSLIATSRESEGKAALKHFEEIGKNNGVKVQSYFVSGDLVPTLMKFATDHDADLILLGLSAERMIADWITCDLMDACEIPVLIVPQDLSHLI